MRDSKIDYRQLEQLKANLEAISKESDAIAIVVSEESGKISIAKDGTLIADVKEEALKNILIKNIITNRLEDNKKSKLKEIKKTKNNRIGGKLNA